MRNGKQCPVTLWLVVVMIAALSPAAWSQQIDKHAHPDLAVEYDYVHSNAPPGGCGCINLNGGSATFAWPIFRNNISLVGRLSGGNGSLDNESLHLWTFTGGVRYQPHFSYHSIRPFGQALIGAAHAGGSLFDGASSDYSGVAFASDLGGGLDLHINHRFSIRLIDADYLVTTFDNGVNHHQNNLRLSAGVVVHF